MFKKVILSLVVFAVLGELLIRFDEKFEVMKKNKVVKIETSIAETPEYTLLKENKIDSSNNSYRVMVIGDSYIHGGGIAFKDNVSQQLKQLLQKNNKTYKDVFVLDVSKPSSNNFDNVQTYFQFKEQFKPQVIILGYNYNDNQGNLDKQIKEGSIDSFKNVKASSSEKKSFVAKVYDVVYQSRLVFFMMHNLHDELKANGIVMSNSAFSQMLKDYTDNRKNWVKSKELLQSMIDDAKANNIRLIVLGFPEMNLLEHPSLFEKSDAVIKSFFTQKDKGVAFIDGKEIYKGEKAADNVLSKYDGHPNERAHKKMADYIYGFLKQ